MKPCPLEMLETGKTSQERVKKFKKLLKDLRSFGHTKKHSFVSCKNLKFLLFVRNCVMHVDQNFCKLLLLLFLLYALHFDSLLMHQKPLDNESSFCSLLILCLQTRFSTQRIVKILSKKLEKHGVKTEIGKFSFRTKADDVPDLMNLFPRIYTEFLQKIQDTPFKKGRRKRSLSGPFICWE